MSEIEVSHSDSIACVTLNRPEKRNAIDAPMRAKLRQSLEELDADHAVRVVILTGAGAAFCAGADLTASLETLPANPVAPRLVAPLERFSKPVIAAVNGAAVGGGLEIILWCDLRIASTAARFGLPEVSLGSLPASGGTQLLPRCVGPALASYMLFTGRLISAEQALAGGLVSELCAPEALMGRAKEIATAIAANAPLSVEAAKKAIRASAECPLSAGLELERALFTRLALSEDRAEGRRAFRERRPPQFRGK
ncbi:MAG: enoyl-CoA hydratase/isomerase family protein [Steroidobacteraceae bacterium]